MSSLASEACCWALCSAPDLSRRRQRGSLSFASEAARLGSAAESANTQSDSVSPPSIVSRSHGLGLGAGDSEGDSQHGPPPLCH